MEVFCTATGLVVRSIGTGPILSRRPCMMSSRTPFAFPAIMDAHLLLRMAQWFWNCIGGPGQLSAFVLAVTASACAARTTAAE
ncbi:hypothetical protein DAI22_03g126150 [Oryza sativa Japonica Group]|nr:hypothetical protein DAI22_03g126150 [Oryza sativa Japonica Group]